MKKLRILVSISLLITIFLSCRAIREHKDNKAISRVLANPNSLEKVYEVALGLHPINNLPQVVTRDSIVYMPFKTSQSIPPTLISKYPNINWDSIKNLIPKDTVPIENYHFITITQQDSTLQRRLNLITDKYNTSVGENNQLKSQVISLKKGISKRTAWEIIIGIIVISLIVGLIILLFKR